MTSESIGSNRVITGRKGGDQAAWILERAPDRSDPPANTPSCIIYGKALPGYKEKSLALPLTPADHSKGYIRADNTGVPLLFCWHYYSIITNHRSTKNPVITRVQTIFSSLQ